MKQKNNLVVTIGSSKGGTCAILYGLMTNAEYIIAGACQYRIGSYLNCPYHINSQHELTGKKEVGFDDIKDIYSLFQISDLGIFPGTHSVLWEACANGLPCIFKHWDGIEHVLVHDKLYINGRYFGNFFEKSNY